MKHVSYSFGQFMLDESDFFCYYFLDIQYISWGLSMYPLSKAIGAQDELDFWLLLYAIANNTRWHKIIYKLHVYKS